MLSRFVRQWLHYNHDSLRLPTHRFIPFMCFILYPYWYCKQDKTRKANYNAITSMDLRSTQLACECRVTRDEDSGHRSIPARFRAQQTPNLHRDTEASHDLCAKLPSQGEALVRTTNHSTQSAIGHRCLSDIAGSLDQITFLCRAVDIVQHQMTPFMRRSR